MPDTVPSFLTRARAGDPVYVTEVRRAFEALPGHQTFRLGLNLVLPDGTPRTDVLMVPRYAGAPADETAFVEEYVFAEVYNRLSALGPRSLDFVAPAGADEARRLHGRFVEAFGLGQSRKDRRGYGRAVNVLERLVDSLDHRQGTTMGCRFVEGTPVATPRTTVPTPGAVAALGRRALAGVGNRTLLGIDVGGSDIKLALVAEGRIVALLEYDWFPAQFTRIGELTDPIDGLVELAGLQARAHGFDGRPDATLAEVLAPAWSGSIGHDDLTKLLEATARWRAEPGFRFEGIGLSFPDVVVADKIVGGEVYKTRGIRNNPAIDYEAEFRTLTALDDRLARHLAPGARVSTINDGPMAAFTAVVEGTIADPRAVAPGLLAHTLGTELGTGWVTEAGTIPDLPLEVYNFLIDLGSYPERAFGCDDPRSVKNFNTDLPGTLQKYTSQSGVFRLALKHFPHFRPDLMTEIVARGFLKCREGGGLEIPTEPVDQRKPFLEYLMALPDRDADPTVARLFREVGEFLAVATWEVNQLLSPAAGPRVLFGRMVKNATCFRLMQEGAAALDPTLVFVQAADGLAESPLMKQLQADPHRTVAQFAQAVGAVYFTASQLPEAADR